MSMESLNPIERRVENEGARIVARGRIPCELELYKDHFPDFPVLPGVLTLEILKRTIAVRPEQVRLTNLQAVRFQTFLKPGDEWHSESERVSAGNHQEVWKVRLGRGPLTAVAGRMTFKFEGGSENGG